MKFQRGTIVRVKSKEQLLEWFEENSYKAGETSYKNKNGVVFPYPMFKWCGRLVTIEQYYPLAYQECYTVKESDWTFLVDWLLPAYSTFVEIDE